MSKQDRVNDLEIGQDLVASYGSGGSSLRRGDYYVIASEVVAFVVRQLDSGSWLGGDPTLVEP